MKKELMGRETREKYEIRMEERREQKNRANKKKSKGKNLQLKL